MTVSAVGIVTDIAFKNGNSNGRDWTKTNFKLTEYFTADNGETKPRTFFLSSFKPIQLMDGGVYFITGELRNTKGQDNQWRLEVQAQSAYPLNVPQNQPAPQQAQPQYNNQYQSAPQQSYQQTPQYNNGYPQQGYPQQRPAQQWPNGQENFTNDDIPF